jgi:hypothetical protein
MPYYNLKRMSDEQEFATAAATDAEALFYFSRDAGEQLTLDGDGPPPYLLGKRMEPLGWVDLNIAVYAAS